MTPEEYIISIVGTQEYEDTDDSEISINTYGSYVERNGAKFISYKEYDEENSQKSQTAIVKVEEPDCVTMMKAGTSTRLILQEGKRHSCVYSTPYGPLTMGIYTSSVETNLDESGGEIKVKYTIDINSTMSSKNSISIKIQKAEKNIHERKA